MSHFSHAHQSHSHQPLDGLHGLAVPRLPQRPSLPKLQNSPPARRGAARALVAADHLYATVCQVFGGADQILFDLATAGGSEVITERSMHDPLVRIDSAADDRPRPASLKRLLAAIGLAKAKETLHEDDWVVLVADETTLDLQQATQLLQQLDHLRRFLLIWCGPETSGPLDAEISPAASGAGLLSTSAAPAGNAVPFDRNALFAALTLLRAQSTAAVLDLQLRQAFLEPTAPRDEVAAPDSGAILPRTADEPGSSATMDALLKLAEADRRIVLISLDADTALAPLAARFADRYFEIPVADADALAWCAGLAAGGCRPVLCASQRALARAWPTLADEICRPQHAVKIVVLASSESESSEPPSSLDILRILPDTPLMVARDGGELAPMLEFAVAYDGPAAIWCSQSTLPKGSANLAAVDTAPRPRWQFGRAEVIGGLAGEVALIGWGETAAAAERASFFLSRSGLRTTIVNARFLQPLDRDAIVEAARTAQVCLVLDDSRWHAGFAADVLEQLAAAGVTTPTSVLQMQPGRYDLDLRDARDDFALQIADRCRWLAEPLRGDLQLELRPAQTDCPEGPAHGSGWLQLFGNSAAKPAGAAHPEASLQPLTDAPPDGLGEFDFAAEQRQILAVEFSPQIRAWIRDYEVVGNRNVYLWRWCLHGLQLTTLPCVEPALRQSLCETKLLAVMLGVMLDDVADLGGNLALLKVLNEVMVENKSVDLSAFNAQEQAYGRFTERLADETWSRLRQYARFGQFEELLVYDHRQIVNAMDYSSLLNRNLALVNLAEHDVYSPHNMQMMSFATMDLMAARNFDRRELGRLRAVVWHAQSMGRIGNLLSTWQREVKVRDFTSGVFARAVQQGDLELDDLEHAPTDAIERAINHGAHDAYFAERWRFHQRAIEAIAPQIRCVDMRPLLVGLKRLISMELGSRGLK